MHPKSTGFDVLLLLYALRLFLATTVSRMWKAGYLLCRHAYSVGIYGIQVGKDLCEKKLCMNRATYVETHHPPILGVGGWWV